MNLLKYSILYFVFILVFYNSNGQQIKWSLKKCIDYAIENNIDLIKNKLNIDFAKQNLISAKANFLPNLNASATHNYSFGSSINSDNTRIKRSLQSNDYNINSSITLFNGFRNRNFLKQNKINKEISELELENAKNNISLSIANSYLQILLNKELIRVAESKLKISKKQLNRVKKQVETGLLAEGSLFEAESSLARDQFNVVDSKNNFNLSKLYLAQFLQLEDFNNFDIQDVNIQFTSYELINTDINEVYKLALKSFPEIKIADKNMESASYGVKISRGQFFPTLTGSYSFSTFWKDVIEDENTFPQIKQENAYFRRLDLNKSHGGGITLQIPIFNKMQLKSDYNKAKIKKQIAEFEVINREKELKRKILEAHANAKAYFKSYESSQKSELSTRIAFEFAEKKYNVGAISIYDFNIANNNLVKAQSDLIRAKYNFLFSLKVLKFYSGIPLAIQ